MIPASDANWENAVIVYFNVACGKAIPWADLDAYFFRLQLIDIHMSAGMNFFRFATGEEARIYTWQKTLTLANKYATSSGVWNSTPSTSWEFMVTAEVEMDCRALPLLNL